MQICVIAGRLHVRRSRRPAPRDGRLAARWPCRPVRDAHQRGHGEEATTPAFADAIFKQICGFGEYGFPESHAYSFALLAYISLWMKCHEPAIFLTALINSQPMGFYAPSQLVQDAVRHGVEVRPIDVCESDWDCSLERRADGGKHPAVRLGLRLVGTLSQAAAERLTQARRTRGFANVDDLARRAGLDTRELQALAQADALQSLAGHRRLQLWTAAGQKRIDTKALLADAPIV